VYKGEVVWSEGVEHRRRGVGGQPGFRKGKDVNLLVGDEVFQEGWFVEVG
jgi:hypothetical protein